MDENKQKHALVEELNSYVSSTVSEMLEQEREFFESDTRDKLKVPPFTKVKRIPRDYTNEEQIVLKYKHQKDLEDEKALKMAKTNAARQKEAQEGDDSNV